VWAARVLILLFLVGFIGIQESFTESDSVEITSKILTIDPPILGETVEIIFSYDVRNIDPNIPLKITEGFRMSEGFDSLLKAKY